MYDYYATIYWDEMSVVYAKATLSSLTWQIPDKTTCKTADEDSKTSSCLT